jgi:hypothetical protein
MQNLREEPSDLQEEFKKLSIDDQDQDDLPVA